MLASPGIGARTAGHAGAMPSGRDWMHEVKWDGVRLMADIQQGKVLLHSRSDRDVSAGFPELQSLRDLASDALLDGEAIVWRDGLPSFGDVVDRIHIGSDRRSQAVAAQAARDRPMTFIAFDLLRLDGLDITTLALRHRRSALESIWTEGASRSLAQTYADGDSLLRATAEQGLEGVVSKRWDSAYQPGVRSKDWVKFAHRATASFVVGGWRPEVGSQRLGAVLVGQPVPGSVTELRYRGRVGSGLAGRAGQQLAELMAGSASAHCPFIDNIPRVDAEGTTWVTPLLVVDVAALNIAVLQRHSATAVAGDTHTDTGRGEMNTRLRQPAYLGVRADLNPEDMTDV